MPRARKPQAPKAQRVDLQQAKAPVPVAGNNLPYGQKQQMQQAVAAAPLAREAAPPAAPMEQAAAAAPPTPGGLFRPSEMPRQPVTTGLAVGPGAGPEVLPSTKRKPPSIAVILTAMADESEDPDIAYLAYKAQQAGL